jgi:hypothetical protein
MSAWLGPIIVHWPALLLPLARALTELYAFCAFKLSSSGMSPAGYARCVNSSSAAVTADGPFSTEAVSFNACVGIAALRQPNGGSTPRRAAGAKQHGGSDEHEQQEQAERNTRSLHLCHSSPHNDPVPGRES